MPLRFTSGKKHPGVATLLRSCGAGAGSLMKIDLLVVEPAAKVHKFGCRTKDFFAYFQILDLAPQTGEGETLGCFLPEIKRSEPQASEPFGQGTPQGRRPIATVDGQTTTAFQVQSQRGDNMR